MKKRDPRLHHDKMGSAISRDIVQKFEFHSFRVILEDMNRFYKEGFDKCRKHFEEHRSIKIMARHFITSPIMANI